MSLSDKIHAYFTIFFCVIILIKVYKNVSSKKYKTLNIKNIMIYSIYSLGQIYLAMTQYTIIKLFANFIFRFILYHLVFRDKTKTTLIKTMCIYILEISIEILSKFLD